MSSWDSVNMLETLLGKEKDDLKNDVESALTHLKVLVTQSCLTLCDPTDCSSLGSSVHGILQARILEWVGTSFSWGSSQPRDWTWVFCIAGRFFTVWNTSAYDLEEASLGWMYSFIDAGRIKGGPRWNDSTVSKVVLQKQRLWVSFLFVARFF